MRDRYVLPLLALIALGLIALAVVWPQGQGRRSPAPFGRPMATPRQTLTSEGRTVNGIRGREEAPATADRSR
jgi:hypothetical protein